MTMILTRRRFAAILGSAAAAAAISRPAIAAEPADFLSRTLATIEARLDARLGVFIQDTGSAREWTRRADERFPMCSTFKALASGAILARVDAGSEDLARRIRFGPDDVVTYSPVTKSRTGGDGMTLAEICEAAITQSDNTAGNLIIESLGGPAGVTDFARSIGDGQTRLDRMETALNEATPGDPRDTTTPRAMAGSLRALVLGGRLSQASRERLAGWLVANRTGDAKLRAGLPKDWRIGDKTGGGDYGTMNDIAVIWPPRREPLVVALYMTQTAASFDDRNAAVAEIGRALAAALDA